MAAMSAAPALDPISRRYEVAPDTDVHITVTVSAGNARAIAVGPDCGASRPTTVI
jgi:hypothetical protein